jgi:nitrogen fixation NifU-like protein
MNQFAYSDKVKQHFLNPQNFLMGDEKNFDFNAKGIAGNIICGDEMIMYLQIKGGKILDAKWKTYGCASAVASTSVLSEMIKGKTIKEALEITPEQIEKELDYLPKHKFHCSVLGDEALRTAIADYRAKKQKMIN